MAASYVWDSTSGGPRVLWFAGANEPAEQRRHSISLHFETGQETMPQQPPKAVYYPDSHKPVLPVDCGRLLGAS